jgi:small subunit ribosomal protein S15
MSVSTATKSKNENTVKKFAISSKDTGSPEVQVALLTRRINELTSHLKGFVKDHSARGGLMKMVGQRRRLLTYLREKDHQRYSKLIQALELRK